MNIRVEGDEEHGVEGGPRRQKASDLAHRDDGGLVERKTEGPAADRRERDGTDPVRLAERKRAAVARGEQLGLPRATAAPDRSHGVDDEFRGQLKPRCCLSRYFIA